jgi:hypothetical protein
MDFPKGIVSRDFLYAYNTCKITILGAGYKALEAWGNLFARMLSAQYALTTFFVIEHKI